MSRFQLSRQALRDLDKIRRRLHREASVAVADMVEDAIYAGIAEVARLRMIGHSRADIRDNSLLFYYVYEYAIIFRRKPEVFVVRVIHGARDLPRVIEKS